MSYNPFPTLLPVSVGAGGFTVTIGAGSASIGSVNVGNWPATQAVSIASMPSTPVTGTFWQATQPVSGTVGISGTVPVSGAFWPATQPVSIASMPTTAVTGTFWQATQPVSISATVPVSGPLTDTQLRATAVPVSGTFWQTTQPVSGSFWQTTQPVSIAATVTVSGPLTDTQLRAAAVPVSIAAALPVTPPTLTKGTQGASGLSVQNLKDAGRVSFGAATVIGGVTAVTTEALLSVVQARDGVAAAAATTIAATSGKRLRLQAIIVSTRSTSAAVLSGRFALRMNPAAAVTATSPIIAILTTTQQAAALAEAGDTCIIVLPDGFEISGTQNIGLTQVCLAVTGSVYASIIGFEY